MQKTIPIQFKIQYNSNFKIHAKAIGKVLLVLMQTEESLKMII